MLHGGFWALSLLLELGPIWDKYQLLAFQGWYGWFCWYGRETRNNIFRRTSFTIAYFVLHFQLPAIDSLSVQPSDLNPATYFYLELFYLLLCCLSASCTNSVTYRMPMMNHWIALVPGLPCIGMHILISCTLTNCHVPAIHFLSDLQLTSKVKASCYFATLYCMPFPDISYNQPHQKEWMGIPWFFQSLQGFSDSP